MSTQAYPTWESYCAAVKKLESYLTQRTDYTTMAEPAHTWVWVDISDYRRYFSSFEKFPTVLSDKFLIRLKEAIAVFEHGESWLEILRP